MKNASDLKKVEVVNIVKERYGRKRFVRYKTGAELYDMSQSSLKIWQRKRGQSTK